MKEQKPKIVLVGGGGHCKAVIDVIELQGKYELLGVLDPSSEILDVLGYPVLGGDEQIEKFVKLGCHFCISVGQIKSSSVRRNIAAQLNEEGAKLGTVISPLSYVSRHSKVGEGSVVMHGVTINSNAFIGRHCIINTKANVEHDAVVEDFCHISTCSVINGSTIVREGSFIGSNATLSHNIEIKKNSVVSANKFVK